MEYRIIRGRNQIGGTITEIRTENARVWVDFGMELSVKDLYASDGFIIQKMQENPPDAILFTHIHGDHIGLLYTVPDDVKIYLGPIGLEMLKNIRRTLLRFDDLEESERDKLHKEMNILEDTSRVVCYETEDDMDVFGIKVTPFYVDHSVADAYMLRFEADGKCIVHTGDFRNHGRKGETFLNDIEQKIASVPVDVLITEGTMMSRDNGITMTEEQMQEKAQRILEQNKYAFLICSSTNVESLASFYWAMVIAGKKRGKKPPLVGNSYVKEQLKLFTETLGEDDWRFRFHRSYPIRDSLNQVLSNGKTQKQQMIDEGFVMLVGTSEYYHDLMEEFREHNPVLIYSMWDGYLREGQDYTNQELIDLVNKWKPNVEYLHTSGHASKKTIAEMINIINPREAIVPIHTENVNGFFELPIHNQLKYKIEGASYMRDNRAVTETLFNVIAEGGPMHDLVKLVKGEPELEMCFRGNSGDGFIIVYYNNHVVFRVSGRVNAPKVEISANQGRYTKDWQEKYGKLGLDLAVCEKVRKNKNSKSTVEYVKSYNIKQGNYIRIQSDNYDLEFWKKTWGILKEILDDYLSDELKWDWYRNAYGVEQTDRKKDPKIEKKAQQRLFCKMNEFQDGFYFYDLEYMQKGDKEANKNKPDALAIEYRNGEAVSLSYVEVKSKKKSLDGKSSLEKHIAGMCEYISNSGLNGVLRNRIVEANDILEQYRRLDIRPVPKAFTANEIENLERNQSIMIILTDEAEEKYEMDLSTKDRVDNQIKNVKEKGIINVFFYLEKQI